MAASGPRAAISVATFLLAVVVAGAAAGEARAVVAPRPCSTFGPTFKTSYNKRAVKVGTPVRILAACCHSTGKAGVSHCFVTVTLAGTNDLGCESVDIGLDDLPVGPGKHELCLRAA